MKSFIMLLVLVGFVLVDDSFAEDKAHVGHEHHEHHEQHHHHDKSSDRRDAQSINPSQLLGSIHSSKLSIDSALEQGSLEAVHDYSETIVRAAKKLSEQADVVKDPRSIGMLKNLIRLANDIHSSADNNDRESLESGVKKLDSLLPLIYGRFAFDYSSVKVDDNSHAHHPKAAKCDSPDVTIDIVAKQYDFTPSTIKVKKDQKVCLRLASEDVEHGIMIDHYHAHFHGSKTTSGEVQFVADTVGDFDFICHQECGIGHADMKGKFIVEP